LGVNPKKIPFGSILPADSLHVIVGADRQFMAATQAAALENLTPIRSCHAGAKAMYAQATMNFGLIRPFG